jgi:hypothetical protein
MGFVSEENEDGLGDVVGERGIGLAKGGGIDEIDVALDERGESGVATV